MFFLDPSQTFYKVRPNSSFLHARLTHSYPPGLQQRDRLSDSQVYLKVINPNEIRLGLRVQLATRSPCDFVILYIASLLRVSIYPPHAIRTQLTPPAKCFPVPLPRRQLDGATPKRFLHLRLRHPPTSSTHWKLLQSQHTIRLPDTSKIDVSRRTGSHYLGVVGRCQIHLPIFRLLGPHVPSGRQQRLRRASI